MILDSAYLTVQSDLEVGSLVKYLIEHKEDQRAFELKIAREALPLPEDIITLHLVTSPMPAFYTLANGQEIVRCRTKTAQNVDIMFSIGDGRAYMPCYVFVGDL